MSTNESADSIPPKRTSGRKGRWRDPLIVHDDIRFGTNIFRATDDPNHPADDAANS